MRRSDAIAVVAAVQAFRPWPEIPDSTVAAWATVLEEYDVRDGMEAVPIVGRAGGFLELVEIEDVIRDVRDRRLAGERPALPAGRPADGISFGEWYRDHATSEQQATARRVFPTLFARFGAELGEELCTEEGAG